MWLALSWRILLALALIGVALAVHWFDREGLRDTSDGHVSLIDVVYFTMITVTTVGYGDIVPVTAPAAWKRWPNSSGEVASPARSS